MSFIGSMMQAGASKDAAQIQSQTALQVANMMQNAMNQSLGFQQQVYGNTLQNQAPWLASGQGALANLNYLMGTNATQPQSGPGAQPGPVMSGQNPGMGQNFGPGSPNNNIGWDRSTGIVAPPSRTQDPRNGPPQLSQNIGPDAQPQTITPEGGSSDGGAMVGGTGGPGSMANNATGLALPVDQMGSLVNPSLGGPGSLLQGYGQNFTAPKGQPGMFQNPNGQLPIFQGMSPFQAPSYQEAQSDPGYQFALQQGENAINNSAAAKGTLFSGQTMADLNNYAQGAAAQQYQNAYNRALQSYNTNFGSSLATNQQQLSGMGQQFGQALGTNQQQLAGYGQNFNQALQGFGTNYDVWSNNQGNIFNRLAAMSGTGQTAVNNLSGAGQNFANSAGNILSQGTNAQGQQMNNSAAALASGQMGAANAWANFWNQSQNNATSLAMLAAMCWVAVELWGENDPRVWVLRAWLILKKDGEFFGHQMCNLYRKYGQRVAAEMHKRKWLKEAIRPLFNFGLKQAIRWMEVQNG